MITREAIVDLNIVGDKVFLWLDGLQCFNLNNGQKVWEVAYENDITKSNNLNSINQNAKIWFD
ncbi:hypothetical protein MASR2M52_16970 [Pedobacter sp.]